MPIIEVNGCHLFYEAFGVDRPHQSPVLLIHGSTQTGQSCWGLIAPLLAQKYQVIVPDCRGHGQSTNPGLSYSFKEMAQDCAELIRALGYQRAHIIGHSNGGNVALVILMEYPEIVQSAVLQAANAYVSSDLLEKEPLIFNPERVEKEAPEWMNEMVRLHAPSHGSDYWRKLLKLTVAEIISAPNYSAEDLSGVDKPVLVIQGEKDHVNAPARHAQFLADHIPYAELWIPQGIGHNVHDEIPCDWINRVTTFLENRGDEYNEMLHRLMRAKFGDERTTIFQVHASSKKQQQENKLALTGKVLTLDQSEAAVAFLELQGVRIENHLQVLIDETTAWGVIQRSVSDLRKAPSNRAERVSQALLGEMVQVLENRGEWSWVRMEEDNYLGWIHSAALRLASHAQAREYRMARNARVSAGLLDVFKAERKSIRERWGKLPFAVLVHVVEWLDEEAVIFLPDGNLGSVAKSGLTPIENLPEAEPNGKLITLGLIERFTGVPYLWGGRTPFGFDCSGLAQIYYGYMNISLPRDADQQYQVGKPIQDEPQPGDLLFFGEADADDHGCERAAHISHVAISLGGEEFIHANGTAWGVSINSLDPNSPRYRPWLKNNLVGIRRFP